METQYRIRLDKSSKKYLCTSCGKHRFVRYIDTETNQYLPEHYGRCDREADCGYFLDPYKDGYVKSIINPSTELKTNWKSELPLPNNNRINKNTVFIPKEILEATRKGYDQNIFFQNLLTNVPFPLEQTDIERVIDLYKLGTVTKGNKIGATTFPFIDIAGNVRAIQVKQFDETNHTTGTDFLHSILKRNLIEQNKPIPVWLTEYENNDLKVSCLFGSHLLSAYPHNIVALVEAPKSAIYGTMYFGFPDRPENLLWLAVYNLSSLNLEKVKVLEGRNVVLFPDLSEKGSAFELWTNRAAKFESLMPGTRFIVSDLLEKNANKIERLNGSDLADFLIKQNWRIFRQPNATSIKHDTNPHQNKLDFENKQPQSVIPLLEEVYLSDKQFIANEQNNLRITTLDDYFSSIKLPSTSIQLNAYSLIDDVSVFVKTNLEMIKANKDNSTFEPYFIRLQTLKLILQNGNNH
jgi:hypothetical protein